MSDFPNLTVVDHPLIGNKLGLLRSVDTPTKLFRKLVEEIAMLMAYEVTCTLEEEEVEVVTPLETMTGHRIPRRKLVVVPVLRAGLGMVEGVMGLIPSARVGHVGLARDEESLQPVEYYFKVPSESEARRFLVVDPMLARGGSASTTIARRNKCGVRGITHVPSRGPRRCVRLGRGSSGRGTLHWRSGPAAQRRGLHLARTRRRERSTLRH